MGRVPTRPFAPRASYPYPREFVRIRRGNSFRSHFWRAGGVAGREEIVGHGGSPVSRPRRCSIPGFDGAIFSAGWRDALWARFFTGAPRQQRRSVERYSSQESLRALANRFGANPKTIAKWKSRDTVADRRTGPKEPRSTVLSIEEEAIIVAFRKHTLLPLDDCLYALQATIPHLTRSSLHRCLQRHGISRLPMSKATSPRKKFKSYPIGFFHIDIAEVQTGEGKLYLFVAIDRTSKFAFAQLVEKANRVTACTKYTRF